ncbi:helix-turn-helix domain-containing protein [Streptomyces sp. NPDC001380]|uniref:helix-turn-helix domain-containing protein n=1 Tax=Streptomyces sp. NPDC001380 TaxID=3364566 RepID=UPI003679DD7F
MAGEREWLTVSEIAARYGISTRTAYRWVASGRGLRVLRTGPTGRGIRVNRDDMERLERERTWGAMSETAA